MKIIDTNTESVLLEKARSLEGKLSAWRSIYFNFSNLSAQYLILRKKISADIIKALSGEDEGYVFFCPDGDIVILFRGQLSPLLNKLGDDFKSLVVSKDKINYKDDFVTLFDLEKHFREFLALSESKNKIENKNPEVTEKTPAKVIPDLDKSIFNSAKTKREKRKRLQVMVVEDDPFTRRLVTGILKANYDVVEAGSGIEAIQVYQHNAPDAVFLDIELGDTTGHVLIEKFLNVDKHAFVVMLSANSIKENIIAALEKGAQGFVTKPFAKDKLLYYLGVCESSVRNSARR